MKKHRPYLYFPTDIIGKTVVEKYDRDNVALVISMTHCLIYTHRRSFTLSEAFEKLEFVDGSPVGEEYYDKPVLLRDMLCCVRGRDSGWIPQYFCNESKGILYFYMDGKTSYTSDGKTSAWDYVTEYDSEIIGTMQEPKNGYIKHIKN